MGAPPEMRIDVAPDGHVQLAVSLSHAVDPTLVASVVAAVRHGIIHSTPPAIAPPPPNTSHPNASNKPSLTVPPSSPPQSPATPAPPLAHPASTPSPHVSVKQRVREFDADNEAPSLPLSRPDAQIDASLREFASTPALRFAPNRPAATAAPPATAVPVNTRDPRSPVRTHSLPSREPRQQQPSQNALASQQTSSSRSLSDLTDDVFLQAEPRHDAVEAAAIVPSSPYVGVDAFQHDDDDADDVWDSTEYIVTEEYNDEQPSSHVYLRHDNLARPAPNIPLRPNTWRLFASFGSLRPKRSLQDELHEGTLAHAPPPSHAPHSPSRRITTRKRTRARALFTRGKEQGQTVCMEFSSSIAVERMLAEVGKIVKALDYQVWRRAGENKLRCIRTVSDSHEMHVVIVVGCVGLPGGTVSVVQLRRAKGDRYRTEAWRFAVLYREIVDRLKANGVDVSAQQS